MFRIRVGDKDINDVVAERHRDNEEKSGVIKSIADNLEKNIGNLEEIGEIVERLRVEYPKISKDIKKWHNTPEKIKKIIEELRFGAWQIESCGKSASLDSWIDVK